MQKIVDVHFPHIQEELVKNAMKLFYDLRDLRGMKKRPSTSEFLDWLKLLLLEQLQAAELEQIDIRQAIPPHIHALLKNEQDINLLDELRRMGRRF